MKLKLIIKKYLKRYPKVYRALRGTGGKWKVRGLNNCIINKADTLKGCIFKISGNDNVISIAEGVRFRNVKIDITGNGHSVIIGKNVKMRECGRIRIEDFGNRLEVGANTSMVNVYFSLQDNNTSVEIGKDCLLSSQITFRTSDSHSIVDFTGKRLNHGKNIKIGDHVWIGNGVTILKGVTIGENSVIGTCSMVTKNVGSNSLAVGVPAKVVKTGINWDKNRIQ